MVAVPLVLSGQTAKAPAPKGILLENLTWVEAEKVLTPQSVVVIALGAESKEHGPHLKLKNDWLIAEYLKQRVLTSSEVIVAPTINYSFYPAFLEYPGSTSLRRETARDVVVDICKSLSTHGPRRFYVINTGVSTTAALEQAVRLLSVDGIVLRYTNLLKTLEPVEKEVAKQEGGTHADEIETSMMLYIAPESVDMTKAVKDFHPPRGAGGLTRNPNGPGVYSATGTFGDPTLATQEKGKKITEALVAAILDEIERLRSAPLPPPGA
jgi:creatinine amidohydrolase